MYQIEGKVKKFRASQILLVMRSDLTWPSSTTKVENINSVREVFRNSSNKGKWATYNRLMFYLMVLMTRKGKPSRSPGMGKPVCCWVIVWLPAISGPMCYVWLLFLSRWKRDRNAVMTNGRLERFIGQLSMFFLTQLSFRKSLIHLGNKYHLYHPADSVISSPCFILGCRLDL